MIEYELKNREGIEVYCHKNTVDLAEDVLTNEDWVELETVSMSFIISIIDVQVIKILAPF